MKASLHLCGVIALSWGTLAQAHDPWIETNTAVCKVGEAVDVDLRLGNHGNGHRDFKLAGRLSLDWTSFEAVGPDGKKADLKPLVVETAVAPKEGYWTAHPVLAEPGVHTFVQSLDRVMNHGKPVRGIRTAKSFVLASESLDNPVNPDPAAASKPLGLAFELVFDTCPVTQIGIGQPIKVRVLRQGKPVAGVVVSFIPRGATLAEGFDADYERKTDGDGKVTWTPKESSTVLIVAHLTANDEKTADYVSTSYSATATVRVPRRCACCGDLSQRQQAGATSIEAALFFDAFQTSPKRERGTSHPGVTSVVPIACQSSASSAFEGLLAAVRPLTPSPLPSGARGDRLLFCISNRAIQAVTASHAHGLSDCLMLTVPSDPNSAISKANASVFAFNQRGENR